MKIALLEDRLTQGALSIKGKGTGYNSLPSSHAEGVTILKRSAP
jgi:hypothetical protein